MANVNINIRTDAEVKKAAQALFAQLGMDMTTAVNIFLRQAISKRTLPLEISPVNGNAPKLGGWEGKIEMPDDFDAPLADFKEYM
ncbi:MAG: type II toxin-antitoxin system RelB/DinJ family antitoxin [Oscillospiraceae bacterium]|jgi:DNA-damage-inducible protein J|nr:type II toxin-antitoxin system RelB/DinJ family antitoxin [Oscillospiraceae bacterium]